MKKNIKLNENKFFRLDLNHTSNYKGITLIALIITIIVMLILVGVTLNVALNGGLFVTAKEAVKQTQIADLIEKAQTDVLLEQAKNGGEITKDKLKEILDKYFKDVPDPLPDDLTGVTATAKDEWGGYKDIPLSDIYDGVLSENHVHNIEYKKVTEIFDSNGKDEEDENYNPNALHIGDFVNYDAGTWTKEDIEAIQVGQNGSLVSANNSESLPTEAFQFGGFKAGDSRNRNATPYYSTTYNYVKDSNGKAITGWRLFDVEEDGSITLISAGCPEDYCNIADSDNGFKSEYILSGYIDTKSTTLNIADNYTKRDWNKYVNENQHATKATTLTKTNLNDWYNKYMEQTNANAVNNTVFRTVYKTKYETLIDNYSSFHIASNSGNDYLLAFYPNNRYLGAGSFNIPALGIRVIVTLSSDVQLGKTDTKTIVDSRNEGGPWTYNVWNIK